MKLHWFCMQSIIRGSGLFACDRCWKRGFRR